MWSSHRSVFATSGDWHSAVDPNTLEPLPVVPGSSADDVAQAFAAARLAQQQWTEVSIAKRAEVLRKLHDLVLMRQDEAIALIRQETGKTALSAVEEVLHVALVSRYYAHSAKKILRPQRRTGVLPVITGITVHRHPVGVVGIISPWNYPLSLSVGDALAALMAGNAVVIKPDLQTTRTCLWAADLLREAGLPEGLFCVVIGEGELIGGALIEQADYVCFTGSTRVGRIVAAQAAKRLIGCSLELGGKNAMIVRADADLNRLMELIVPAAFSSAGQLCVSVERIYIDRSVLPEVERRLAARLDGLFVGSLTSEAQVQRTIGHIRDAVTKGARVVVGGGLDEEAGPLVIKPTVLTGVEPDMKVAREETFGPLISLYPVDSDDEAVALANDTAYGLHAVIVSRDKAAATRLAQRLHAGSVSINEGYGATFGSVAAPMGGMGDSGLGRRHGPEGLLRFTELQTIGVQHALGMRPFLGMSERLWLQVMGWSLRLLKAVRWR